MFRIFVLTSALLFVGCYATMWSSLGNIVNPNEFFVDAIQNMIYEVEKRGWSQLKLEDYVIPVNLTLYNWRVVGNATYSNGFLNSIQMIDVSNISPRAGPATIDGEQTEVATIIGMLNLRDVKVGFNVEADFGEEGVHRTTGTFLHTLVQLRFTISKNLITNEVTTTANINSLSAGSGVRMIYMPSSNITEVLSRTYVPSRNWDSANSWGRDVFAPILLQVINEKVPFPHVCFKQC